MADANEVFSVFSFIDMIKPPNNMLPDFFC